MTDNPRYAGATTASGSGGAPREPLIMGVLNVTPDSFSDGGRYLDIDAAVAHGRALAADGAQIIDVGGESTRPGAEHVSGDEERRRILPVIEALSAAGLSVSVDTVRAETARAAIAVGAEFINDVSGGLHDPDMYRVVADSDARYIAMHWRGIPDPSHERSRYGDVVIDVRDELARLADTALAAGVAPQQLILDPGLGFDKTAEQGWRLLAGLPRLTALGYPVLVGVSRKRMLAETLGSQTTMADRDLATGVVSALAAGAGAWGVRVHDVAATRNALAIARAWGVSMPRDRITLTGLEVFAHHGVFDFEREAGQRFLIDAELSLDLSSAAADDALEQTVHYGELAEALIAAVSGDPVDLIETVAERSAAVALSFPGVAEARITVHKPEAPIEATFSDVSVTVVRRAGEDPS